MNTMKSMLQERRDYLKEVMERSRSNIKRINQAEGEKLQGSIYAVSHRKGYQYYLKDDMGLHYLKAAERKRAKGIVQREYDTKVLRTASAEHKIIEKLLKVYESSLVEEVFEEMPAGKQVLVNPIRLSDEEYIRQWRGITYEPLGFREDSPEYYSARGERMRSKSEVIIADMLDRLQIIYLYEKPLYLERIGMVRPDFTMLRLDDRREIYLEHLGMLDDQDYRTGAIRKVREYENSGFFLGDRLIITEESECCSLDIRLIERKIRHIMKL